MRQVRIARGFFPVVVLASTSGVVIKDKGNTKEDGQRGRGREQTYQPTSRKGKHSASTAKTLTRPGPALETLDRPGLVDRVAAVRGDTKRGMCFRCGGEQWYRECPKTVPTAEITWSCAVTTAIEHGAFPRMTAKSVFGGSDSHVTM